MEFTENEKNLIKSIKGTDMRKTNEIKKEPLWKLNLIFTDFEIFFRNGKPLKWFTWKKAVLDIDGDIIFCRKRFHKYNSSKNFITRYGIYVDDDWASDDSCYVKFDNEGNPDDVLCVSKNWLDKVKEK